MFVGGTGPVSTSELPIEKREKEIKELIHQLGLWTISEADDRSGTTASCDNDSVKKSCVSLITSSSVVSGHTLLTSEESDVTSAETSEGVGAEGVSRSDETRCDDRSSSYTTQPRNVEQSLMSPRNWTALSLPLPLPPPRDCQGRETDSGSIPNRLACDKEAEFYRQLCYSRRDVSGSSLD